MNDDLIVQKILKLLENNTAFIGYALNGGIGTKINVRNTETGKTIQALSINVDSGGEVLVVKDSDDGKYKAVTFKAAQQTTERIIQIRKTKPVDDKKIIEYTDADIEVFYLFVKLIDTGSPYPSQLQSTWIRKGSSCTQFVGAYERCNYAAKDSIGGISYIGLPYKPYSSLNECLNDDLGRDAKTPHGNKDEQGLGSRYAVFSTTVSGTNEQRIFEAISSHDEHYGTNYKKLFGYSSIISCDGAMNLEGWEFRQTEPDPISGEIKRFIHCEFSFLPGFTNDCTPAMRDAGYCDSRGFINSKTPPPGTPGVGGIDNSWAYEYGWANLPYSFMYKRHFPQLYLEGSTAPGSFVIFELNPDMIPSVPDGYSLWNPGCTTGGGPYNGSGGNGSGNPVPGTGASKRDMKLSTHKAEIWLGSSRKKEAIKLYELGTSDLFSGMYNGLIIRADETQVDTENRLQRGVTPSEEDIAKHTEFYENFNKNLIDLNIDPRVWIYVLNNKPLAAPQQAFHDPINPQNNNLQIFLDNLYNRTLNLSIISNKFQIVHLKLGLVPRNNLSNLDCKGTSSGTKANDSYSTQSWEYQKTVTIKIKDWEIDSISTNLDTSDLDEEVFWNKDYIERRFLTSFGSFDDKLSRDFPTKLLLRHNSLTNLSEIVSSNHYEQFNFDVKKLFSVSSVSSRKLFIDDTSIFKSANSTDRYRRAALGTVAWWELWNKTVYNKKTKRLSSIVGYDRNYYQIVKSTNLGSNLDYSTYNTGISGKEAVPQESYFEYIPTRPKEYIPSYIRGLRNKLLTGLDSEFLYLTNRTVLVDNRGLLFYFSDWDSRWSWQPPTNLVFLPVDNYYAISDSRELISSLRFTSNSNFSTYSVTKRIDTRRYINNLWAQLIYDGFIKVDVDSYKKVEFTLPTNPSQYKKYATSHLYINSEYNFTNQPSTPTTLETVLTPGTLDVTKQVKITKPENVDLDPNMSFLVYLYPFCTVTKKKKEI